MLTGMSNGDDEKLKHREYMKVWRRENRDKIAGYEASAKEKTAARKKARVAGMTPEELEAYKQRRRAAVQRHREKNKDALNEQARLYMAEKRAVDPEKHREYQKKYVAANRERIAETRALRRAANPEKERVRETGMVFAEGQTIAGMREAQNNRCAICQKALPEGKQCHVDHCHTTGHVRALLCHKCNVGIGHFDDSAAELQKAIDYLLVHEARISAILK